jgi:hypothetical protein
MEGLYMERSIPSPQGGVVGGNRPVWEGIFFRGSFSFPGHHFLDSGFVEIVDYDCHRLCPRFLCIHHPGTTVQSYRVEGNALRLIIKDGKIPNQDRQAFTITLLVSPNLFD